MLKNSLQMSSYDLTKSLAHCTTLQQRFLLRVVAFRAVTLLVGHQDKYPVHWVIVGDEVNNNNNDDRLKAFDPGQPG